MFLCVIALIVFVFGIVFASMLDDASASQRSFIRGTFPTPARMKTALTRAARQAIRPVMNGN